MINLKSFLDTIHPTNLVNTTLLNTYYKLTNTSENEGSLPGSI